MNDPSSLPCRPHRPRLRNGVFRVEEPMRSLEADYIREKTIQPTELGRSDTMGESKQRAVSQVVQENLEEITVY